MKDLKLSKKKLHAVEVTIKGVLIGESSSFTLSELLEMKEELNQEISNGG